MEQPITRTSRPKPRRTDRPRLPRPARADGSDRCGGNGTVAGPGGGGAGSQAVLRAGAGPRPVLSGAVRQATGPRLTGLGCGLFASLVMLAAATADRILLAASPLGYGLVFLVVCTATALWVRRSDLAAAPVSAPIAFTVGLIVLSGDTGGRLMGVFTTLALQAGWLYGGTLLAGLIAVLRGLAPARPYR
ncbi:DUF6542 domain-containing protein [Streptomyces meridianus]|uniref:DUF6542 domain-containing protein n=1 Tax=Streptomyces meridianus TaxID=2938945 RepID=A0ABT0X1S9_9ACTN|nr:DUF6542 domain-containing protein [Streptomyces meridianus]MCM2576255.1 hypothetical protein [Streptomyces meridianus]